MDTATRMGLIKEVGEEIITEAELRELLDKKRHPIAYDGFEPSGTDIHIAQGLLRAININKMTKAGTKFKMLVADWHAWANNKMGGDLARIQNVGKYLIEVWKVSGMDLRNVEFIWASDMVNDVDYWKNVMQVARNTTVNRIIRCGQIMGRKEQEVMQASQILYPCMQFTDIFRLKSDITQLGMDQRKVNILAREIGPSLGFWKPVVVSHHMLMGLGKPVTDEKDALEKTIELKMSKSKPETSIFMNDTEEDINRKINNAFCAECMIGDNPILEYCRYIIFEKLKEARKTFFVDRSQKYGGPVEFETYGELEKAYKEGSLHPLDLKKAVAFHLNYLLEPIRKSLKRNARARRLIKEISGYEVTR
jgi:tyrosyl-tRNA synthetase